MRDGIVAPSLVIDLGALGLGGIRDHRDGIRIGATTSLAAIAADPLIRSAAPALAAATGAAASPQIRAMGTLGGNLLQQTRCPYFRLPGPLGVACQVRRAGSGCSVAVGEQRAAAVLGPTDGCLAVHPSDAAVALAVLEAAVTLVGPAGERSLSVIDLFAVPPGETALRPGEVLVEVTIPPDPANGTSRFRKLQERAAFDFAIVSAAVVITPAGPRIALGGVAWGPWRCSVAEARLGPEWSGRDAVGEAMAAELAAAHPLPGNRFKIDLAIGLVATLLAPVEAAQ
jgi:xanthine dehydrogenase YagS FAD-binding subunit